MSFDAGSAVGSLGLDVSGFTGGILEAQGIAELFPEVVTDFLANPLLGVMELSKEFAETLKDAFTETVSSAESMGLLSQKLGVPVEVFSQWAQLGKTVQVAPERLAQGLRMLEQTTAEALDKRGQLEQSQEERREKAREKELEYEQKHHGRQGNFVAIEEEQERTQQATNGTLAAFERLGIGMDFLQSHLNEPMAIFNALREAIEKVPDPVERMRLATELLGARQSALIPLLTMSKEHVDEFAAATKAMGGITDESEAKAAQDFTDLQTEASIALEGIKKAASMPILDYLVAHKDEIQKDILHLSTVAQKDIGKIWGVIQSPTGQKFIGDIKADVNEIIAALPTAASVMEGIFKDVGDVLKDAVALKEVVASILPKGTGSTIKEAITGGPADNPNSAFTNWMARRIESSENPNPGMDPEVRRRDEAVIKRQLGVDMAPGSSDADVQHWYDAARNRAESGGGAPAGFSGSASAGQPTFNLNFQFLSTVTEAQVLQKVREGMSKMTAHANSQAAMGG